MSDTTGLIGHDTSEEYGGTGVEADVTFISGNAAGAGNIVQPDFTYQEIILGESLLTPGLQTSIICHSFAHNAPIKNYDLLKNASVRVRARNQSLIAGDTSEIAGLEYGSVSDTIGELDITQTVYRLENRDPLDTNNEQMTFRACDPTMLFNAINLVSKSWGCETPDKVVEHVLRSCVGAKTLDIEKATPAMDYLAENIHPFQVINQQANAAMAEGDDPSFLHYMTYRDGGTHHFRSLKSLTKQRPVMTFYPTQTASLTGMNNPHSILKYTFPCDYDLLSDLLNGIGPDGKNMSSVIVFNEKSKMFSVIGNQVMGCGVGGGPAKLAKTNITTAKNQASCNDNITDRLLLRQARMSLLESDKIALRMTVPFNPRLHVGDVIEAIFQNKTDPGLKNYGSGNYLILHLMHNIKRGGYATTNLSCVSQTAGSGIT